jgi:hypothetical protein
MRFIFGALLTVSRVCGNANDYSFCESYKDCRDSFIVSVQETEKERSLPVKLEAHEVSSKSEKGLFIDTAHFDALEKKKNLVVFVSGVHGVEGNTGSTLQTRLIKTFLDKSHLKETGFLFIHAINPWGFSKMRRVTENNVDLNRNFGVDKDLFASKNTGYTRYRKFSILKAKSLKQTSISLSSLGK